MRGAKFVPYVKNQLVLMSMNADIGVGVATRQSFVLTGRGERMRIPTKFHLDGGAIVIVRNTDVKNMTFHIVGIHRKSKARKLSKKLGIAIHKDSKRRNKERWKNGSFN